MENKIPEIKWQEITNPLSGKTRRFYEFDINEITLYLKSNGIGLRRFCFDNDYDQNIYDYLRKAMSRAGIALNKSKTRNKGAKSFRYYTLELPEFENINYHEKFAELCKSNKTTPHEYLEGIIKKSVEQSELA